MESRMSRLHLSTPEDNNDAQTCSDLEEDYACEYRDEIWRNLLEQEAQKPQIQLTSPQLEFRGALVQQLRVAARRLRLGGATLHAAVQLLDLFMDRHELRADRLTHSALAALSLAAKSEEKIGRTPRLSTLARVSGIPLSAGTFRQLEWMMAQHVGWRLLLPTAATFASLAAHHVVRDEELASRSPQLARRLRRDGRRQLRSYLDLTLSDVRLKVMSAAEVGCACVACARAALGLAAWPSCVAAAAGVPATRVAPVARLLQGMMRVLRSRGVDGGGGGEPERGSPGPPPASPPARAPLPAAAETSVVRRDSLRARADPPDPHVVRVEALGRLDGADHSYLRQRRLVEASLGMLDVTGVKRGACRDLRGLDAKRYRLDVPQQLL